jgi:hypothetical protein
LLLILTAELSRVVRRSSFRLGTWSIQSGTAHTLFGKDLTVCPKPLTFDLKTLIFRWSSQNSIMSADQQHEATSYQVFLRTLRRENYR